MSNESKAAPAHLQEITNAMLQEVFAIFASEAAHTGPENAQILVMLFLKQLVGTCVLNSLVNPSESAPRGTSEAEKFTMSWENYQNEKSLIEEAVGEGFRLGFKAFAPDTDPEMLCKVTTIDGTPSDPKISH